jgi:hypothetical protein
MTTNEFKDKIKAILRRVFPPPDDWVDVTDSFGDYVHVVVISHKFDDLREREKLDMLWSALDKSELTESEKQQISVILPYSPVEIA